MGKIWGNLQISIPVMISGSNGTGKWNFFYWLNKKLRNWKSIEKIKKLNSFKGCSIKGLTLLKSPSVHVYNEINKCENDYFSGDDAILLSGKPKNLFVNVVNYWR